MESFKEMMLALGYKTTDVDVAVGAYEEIPVLDPDLMHVKFVMCHEGINGNGDTFTKDVMKVAQDTPKNKPIDWEHGQPIIGHITDSIYKEDANGVGYIEAVGVVYKFTYPELSSQIKAKATTGELKLSMECYYKDANYKVGDQLLDQEQAETLGIIPYVGREYMGKRVARIFKEVIFGGVGVVSKPADRNAIFLSVAKDLNVEVNFNGAEDNGELAKAVAEAITRVVNDFTRKQHNSESNNAVAVAKYVKAFDKAKSNVVAKFNTNTLKTKDQVVAEVRDSVTTLLREVSSISEAYYKGIANEENILHDTLQNELNIQCASNSNSAEAYLIEVEEDYIIYDVIDYSEPHPQSIKTLKASYKIEDDQVSVDYANAIEEIVKGEVEEMSDVNTQEVTTTEEVVATILTETPSVEEASKKNKNDGDPEDQNDNGIDENTEDKNGKPKKKSASEYETEIANLQEQLRTELEQRTTLASELAQLKSRFDQVEAEKVIASRLSELKGAGIEFSGSRLEKEQAKLKLMTDEAYADYKELLFEVAGKKFVGDSNRDLVSTEAAGDQDEDLEDLEDAEASEITVEGVTASVRLNIETPLNLDNAPFGHLRRK